MTARWRARCSRFLLASAVAGLAAGPASAVALTAAEVVERNAAARGGVEAWRRVESMVWAGHVERPGWDGRRAPFVLEQKRPGRTRFEVGVNGQRAVRAFDGREGWKLLASGRGPPEVRAYTPQEVAFARGSPVIEGPLMDEAARGATVTLVGLQDLDGKTTYVLGLRLASGASYRVWVGADDFLELRYDRELVDAQGRPALTSVRFRDYRTVQGLRLPFTIETGGADGKPGDRLVIETVAINPALDDRDFARPGAVPTVRPLGVTVDTRGAAPASGPAVPRRE